jgi:hypothetical protein
MTPKAETFSGTVLGQQGALVLTQFEAFALNGLTGESLHWPAFSIEILMIISSGVFHSHEERRNFMKNYISKTIKEQIRERTAINVIPCLIYLRSRRAIGK